MKRSSRILVATVLAAVLCLDGAVIAGGVPYVREVASYTGGTNTYTLGRWAALTIDRVDVEDAIPTNSSVLVTLNYGDAAGGTRVLGVVTCSGGVGTLSVTNYAYTLPDDSITYKDNYGGDTNAVTATNFVVRLHGFIRDRKPLN